MTSRAGLHRHRPHVLARGRRAAARPHDARCPTSQDVQLQTSRARRPERPGARRVHDRRRRPPRRRVVVKVQKPSQGAQLALVVVAPRRRRGRRLPVPDRAEALGRGRRAARGRRDAGADRRAPRRGRLGARRAAAARSTRPSSSASTKAMPDRAEMAEVILELNRIATDTGIRFESIAPSPATAGQGYQVLPIALDLRGQLLQPLRLPLPPPEPRRRARRTS